MNTEYQFDIQFRYIDYQVFINQFDCVKNNNNSVKMHCIAENVFLALSLTGITVTGAYNAFLLPETRSKLTGTCCTPNDTF